MPSKTQKNVAALAATSLVVAPLAVYSHMLKMLESAYPDLNPKRRRKAFRRMFAATLKGEYQNFDTQDPMVMHHLFMSEYRKITS